MGAMEGIINGSFIVFCLMLVLSIFFGRIFCSFLCPVGGLQECLIVVNDKVPKQGWKNYIKYGIWIIWIFIIVTCFINRNNTIQIDFFYQTDHGISISNIYGYIIYYGVIFFAAIPAILFGKKLFCHYFCWMAPFMVIGTKIRKILHLPGLHIAADKDKCISCMACDKKCSMGLAVCDMVNKGKSFTSECIQCGECVDVCPKDVLHFSMCPEKKRNVQKQK